MVFVVGSDYHTPPVYNIITLHFNFVCIIRLSGCGLTELYCIIFRVLFVTSFLAELDLRKYGLEGHKLYENEGEVCYTNERMKSRGNVFVAI